MKLIYNLSNLEHVLIFSKKLIFISNYFLLSSFLLKIQIKFIKKSII